MKALIILVVVSVIVSGAKSQRQGNGRTRNMQVLLLLSCIWISNWSFTEMRTDITWIYKPR